MPRGSKTWNITKKQTIKLRTTQRSHEKKMLGITWKHKKTAKWIPEQTKLQGIVETIKMLKWNWAGHIMRTNDSRWTKRLIELTPYNKKRKKQENQTLDGMMNYLNLTPMGLKRALNVKNGGNWEALYFAVDQISCCG